MRDPKRILVIRLSALGDVLLATPAVRALKARFPSAEIDWLVEAPYAPLLEANPHARPVLFVKRGLHQGLRGLLALRQSLADRRYDLVVDLQNKPRTHLLHGVAPESIVLRKRDLAQAVRAFVGDDEILTGRHASDAFVDALAPLGVQADGGHLELRITDAMREEAGAVASDGRTVGLAVGARWATKRWPAARFAALAKALHDDGLRPLLLGGPGDAAELSAVRAATPIPLEDTSHLSVGGLAAAIERCRLVVANDSGPVHIASALGVPVVALFGPTAPSRWGPRSPSSAVVKLSLSCSPCSNHGTARCPEGHHACMNELPVDEVLAEARRLLQSPSLRRADP